MRKWAAAVVLCICAASRGQTASIVPRTGATLTISPVRLEFEEEAVGSSSAPENVTLKNETASPIRITQVLASGIDFHVKNKCASELSTGNQCAMEVVFQPATIGERLGVIEIISSDAGSPHYVPLMGTGK